MSAKWLVGSRNGRYGRLMIIYKSVLCGGGGGGSAVVGGTLVGGVMAPMP